MSQKGSGVSQSCDPLVCVFLHPCGLGWFGFCCGFVPPSKPRKQIETLPAWNSAVIAKRVIRTVPPKKGGRRGDQFLR